ncbi:MAG: ribbon-helix-helix protein, CopG family [Nitrospirota bacterium]
MSKVSANIRLDAAYMKELKRVADEKGKSLSQIFHQIISDYLEHTRVLSGKDWKRDSFFQIGKSSGRSVPTKAWNRQR